ncbi:MAG: DUF262 domain-containing protein [Terriglobales bacterium]
MNKAASQFTVADYCKGMKRNEIVVNRDYQRSDHVWPQAARSYLIETILKGFPIPKLYLYQITDVKSRETHKEIVDGQQRSVAILDFYNDKFKVSKLAENEDIRNRKYSELDQEYKQAFLDYAIDVDLFVSATTAEVVEVFRRMNSYTVPLNPEEQRHAGYQGKFKWFINDLADKLEAIFLETGVFREKQLVRMGDNKLLTELCDSFVNGIRTTSKQILDSLYKNRDETFPERDDFYERLTTTFTRIRKMDAIHQTALMKPYMVYSLAQSITHSLKPIRKFNKLFKSPKLKSLDFTTVLPNLSALAQAAEQEEAEGKFADFIKASNEKTNTRENRIARFKWFCRALTSEHI